jgi:hypothetical protein
MLERKTINFKKIKKKLRETEKKRERSSLQSKYDKKQVKATYTCKLPAHAHHLFTLFMINEPNHFFLLFVHTKASMNQQLNTYRIYFIPTSHRTLDRRELPFYLWTLEALDITMV